MGYNTEFSGSFQLNKPLDPLHKEYLVMFSDTRRMRHDVDKLHYTKNTHNGNTRCFELLNQLGMTFGNDGCFYGCAGFAGQDKEYSVVDYNNPPSTQPSLWCHWVPSDDGTKIVWNEAEKFYNYTAWIEYIIETFLKPWGYKLNGMVEWGGEDRDDIGVIQIVNNVVTVHNGKTIRDFNSNATPKPTVAPNTPEIIIDLIRVRNELSTTKKGTAVACKKLDELIKKYWV